uniref:Transmembrane protein n=1 Tax=Heterorhabditis bacteriophora TaxID=37862 RepID=A0A1I7XDS1_HETBA
MLQSVGVHLMEERRPSKLPEDRRESRRGTLIDSTNIITSHHLSRPQWYGIGIIEDFQPTVVSPPDNHIGWAIFNPLPIRKPVPRPRNRGIAESERSFLRRPCCHSIACFFQLISAMICSLRYSFVQWVPSRVIGSVALVFCSPAWLLVPASLNAACSRRYVPSKVLEPMDSRRKCSSYDHHCTAFWHQKSSPQVSKRIGGTMSRKKRSRIGRSDFAKIGLNRKSCTNY